MRILNYTMNSRVAGVYANAQQPSFKRAPKEEIIMPDGRNEQQFFTDTIQQAKSFLGIKNLGLILHQSCFPVKDKDVFIGSHIKFKSP